MIRLRLELGCTRIARKLTFSACLPTLCPMSNLFRKLVAILMLLWLPLFSSSALAATVVMQMPSGACHDVGMPVSATMDMAMNDHDANSASTDGCSTSCGVLCHLACTGYLAVPSLALISVDSAEPQISLYRVSFHSFVSVPLLPPPLARV